MQILDDEYKLKSENNAIKIVYEYPERGYIYDRNGKLLVANQPSYDIMVVPREIKNLDTLKFCELVDITKEEFDKKRDERNLLHQSILNLGNIPKDIIANRGRRMSEVGQQLTALTAASLGQQGGSQSPTYQVKQYY